MMNKVLALLLCAVFVLCLTACQGGGATDQTDSSAITQSETLSGNGDSTQTLGGTDDTQNDTNDEKTSSNDKISQGIELEEDVFDNGDTQSKPSDNNVSDGNQSDDAVSKDNTAEDNSSDDVSEENQSDPDDTIKLPVDWFD